ncbi:MAG: DegV family protein [Clostridiales bacterium]|nr:DegV family protein [Clostridiales bacterium]
MADIQITGDSAWDMPPELLAEGFISVPLTVVLGDKEYLDGVNLTNDDIFAYFHSTGKTPKTAAIPPALYEETFSRALKTAGAVIHISLSSPLSACHNNAKLAAARFRDVYVVDGLTLSCGLALLGLRARDWAREGVPAAEIVARLEKARHKMQCSFVVDDLEFLHKGGRCGGVARFAASLLRIKPTILMDGSMSVGKKYLGVNFKTALDKFADDTFARRPHPDLRRVFITYSTAPADIVDAVREKVTARFNFEKVYVCHTGGTITSHCGENTLGIAFLGRWGGRGEVRSGD